MDYDKKSNFPLANIAWETKHALDLPLWLSSITLLEAGSNY